MNGYQQNSKLEFAIFLPGIFHHLISFGAMDSANFQFIFKLKNELDIFLKKLEEKMNVSKKKTFRLYNYSKNCINFFNII